MSIIHAIGKKEAGQEQQETVLQDALKMIKALVPKKTNVDIATELDSILDELILIKQRPAQFNIHEHFWTLATQRLSYPIS